MEAGDEKVRVHGTIEIKAPPEKIWPYLIEPEKTKQWFTNIEEFKYQDKKPKGVGTTFFWKERSGNRVFNLNFETTEWTEHGVFGFKMTSGDFFKSYTERWVIEPTSSGSEFSFNDHIEFPWGPIGKIIGSFAKKRSAADGQKILANLKELVEKN